MKTDLGSAMNKILIVEDNEFNLDSLSRLLTRKGYDVVTATTGSDGQKVANQESPDLILMDVGLPDMDGHEVTRRLKGDAATAAIPIIALTAHAFDSDKKLALDAGCDGYHTKPVDMARLLRKIENFLQREADA